jgi:Ca2+/Na+ antiporter
MYLLYLTYDNKKQSKEFHESVEQVQEEEELVESRYPILRVANKLIDACFPNLNRRPGQLWLSFWISIVGIIILSKVMIEGAVGIASFLGISPVIIALTILA